MNILVLTSIYPEPDDEKNIGVTPVVKYFCEEWVRQGHNVLVIHNSNYYPKVLYFFPDKIIKKINSTLGIVVPRFEQSQEIMTKNNGLSCYRLPMLKTIPRHISSKKQIEDQFKKIEIVLSRESFVPDVIIGHWENPQIQLLGKMKEEWGTRTSLVFHALVYVNQKKYLNYLKGIIDTLDVIGARSEAIANQVKSMLSLKSDPFICYSGIADDYFKAEESLLALINKKTQNSYLFVGRLIKRKNVKSIMLALEEVYVDEDFVFNVIGDGGEKETLLSIADLLKCKDSIHFKGHKKRDEVIQSMRETEVFIMISDNETFGLVYIEAMSQGCIVVASKNGGMDGIIENGVNGFLCEQGNKDELIRVCNNIRSMSKQEKVQISLNAFKTAKKYSYSNVAKEYLNNVLQ